jgi:ribonuclease HI
MPGGYILYFDGLCEPRNPGGIACYGWLIKSNDEVLASGHGEVCRGPGATNNVAEYTALIRGLEALAALGLTGAAVEVRGDSLLVVKQVRGEWRVRAANLRPLHARARKLAAQLDVTLRWVPREQNTEADALSRKAYQETSGDD